MNLFFTSANLVERLGWVLVHSLWQFSLIALLTAAAASLLRRNSPALRYGVFALAMACGVLSPAATWFLTSSASPPNSEAARLPLDPSFPPVAASSSDNEVGSIIEVEETHPLAAGETLFAAPETAPALPSPTTTEPPANTSLAEQAATWLRPWLGWIVAVWCGGVVLCSLRPLLGWRMLRRLRRVGVSPVSEEVLAALRRASERLGLRRTVRVLYSTLAKTPLVIGYFRPVILLPVGLATSIPAEQLEAILAHELAHVQRRDFLVNLLQTLVETVFFYHPAVWWLSRRLRAEREYCCDDRVVAALDNRAEYGRALLAIAELRGRGSALAMAASDGALLSRVRRIVGLQDRGGSPWSALSLVVCALVVLVALSVLSWRREAEAVQPPGAPPTSEKQEASKPDKNKQPNGLRISGRVLDAQTGKPLAKCRMIPTSVYRDDSKDITWQTQYMKEFTDGRYLYETKRPWKKTKLRIEAEGYRPAVTRAVNKGETAEIDVKLVREVFAGEVRLPNGKPAAKAQLALASWTNEIQVAASKLSYSGHGAKLRKVVETDQQGRFAMPSDVDPWVVVVAHEAGYAEVSSKQRSLSKTPEGQEDAAVIQLKPWGRVEGKVLSGGEPVAGAKYWVYQARADNVFVRAHYNVETDAEGRFVVEQIPPGRFGTCQRYVEGKDGQNSYAISGLIVRFEIVDGKTTLLELGDPGRTLTGKLKAPEGFPHKIDWKKASLRVSLQAPRFRGFRGGGDNQQALAQAQFLQSDEGKKYGRTNVAINADGSFRIVGLPAAEYQLTVSVNGQAVLGEPKPQGDVLHGAQKIPVPAIAPADKAAVDLGDIKLQSLIAAKPQAAAPAAPVWGPTANGLRARIVPVRSSMSEDAIDLKQRAARFAEPEEVAFAVEMENVSDKPIKLLDTRYGDGYGKSKGKANSNWYGQFLFSVDLFTSEGEKIERPDVQVVDLNMLLGGALVVSLGPGEKHRFLLRPTEWLSAMTQPIEPGGYRAAVRYHGLPSRVAARIKEYRPTSSVLGTVSGDIVSPQVPFVVQGAAKKPGKVWGEPSQGLRAAVSLSPMKATYAHGEKPDLKLHVQNVSRKPITLSSHLWLSEFPATVKDSNGKPVQVGAAFYSGWTMTSRATLKPKQIVTYDAGNLGLAFTKERAEKFEHVTNRTLVAPAGKYTIQLSGRFGGGFQLKDGKGKVLAPLEGDWAGELKTDETSLEITNETIPCDILDAATGKPVTGTTVNFRFFKPKSGDVAEEIVADIFWGPKSPSRVYFSIPEQVLQRADREEIEFRWGVGGHPDYEGFSSKRLSLKPFFQEGTKAAREMLGELRLTPKKKEADKNKEAATSPPKGLEFLKPYPKLHGLSLEMTEPQFLAIAKRNGLKPKRNGGAYWIPADENHSVIVMFGNNGDKCSGIQRVRDDNEPRWQGRLGAAIKMPDIVARLKKQEETLQGAIVAAETKMKQHTGFSFEGPELNREFKTEFRFDKQGRIYSKQKGGVPGRAGTAEVRQQNQVGAFNGRHVTILRGADAFDWAYRGPDKTRIPREVDPRDYLFRYGGEPLSQRLAKKYRVAGLERWRGRSVIVLESEPSVKAERKVSYQGRVLVAPDLDFAAVVRTSRIRFDDLGPEWHEYARREAFNYERHEPTGLWFPKNGTYTSLNPTREQVAKKEAAPLAWKIETTFRSWKLNPKFTDADFTLEIPEGIFVMKEPIPPKEEPKP